MLYDWEIPCRTIDDAGWAVFRVSSFGRVEAVEPAGSAFAGIQPLDVYGFVPPGTHLLQGDEPEHLVEDVLRSGEDVTGKAVAFRGPVGSVFVAAAIVSGPLRLVAVD